MSDSELDDFLVLARGLGSGLSDSVGGGFEDNLSNKLEGAEVEGVAGEEELGAGGTVAGFEGGEGADGGLAAVGGMVLGKISSAPPPLASDSAAA